MHNRSRRKSASIGGSNFVFSKAAQPSKTLKSAQICTNEPIGANPRSSAAPILFFQMRPGRRKRSNLPNRLTFRV
jgi:hypothetical protein